MVCLHNMHAATIKAFHAKMHVQEIVQNEILTQVNVQTHTTAN